MDAEEFMRDMPEGFVYAYARLLAAGTGEGGTGGQLDSALGNVREGTSGGNGKRTSSGGLQSDEAIRFKAGIHRKLRVITRQTKAFLDADTRGRRAIIGGEKERCTSCGRFTEENWRYCPRCGNYVGED